MWDDPVVAETGEAPNAVAHPFDPKLVSSSRRQAGDGLCDVLLLFLGVLGVSRVRS